MHPCIRIVADRRAQPTPMLSRYWLVGRRLGGRRAGEVGDRYVDRCTGREFWLVGSLVGLAVVDWAWTLMHLGRGVEEANPVLGYLLATGGVWSFSVTKLGLTFGAGLFLLRHARFGLTRRLLPLAIAVYAAVMCIHAATSAIPANA